MDTREQLDTRFRELSGSQLYEILYDKIAQQMNVNNPEISAILRELYYRLADLDKLKETK